MTGDDFNSAYNQVLHRAFLGGAPCLPDCRRDWRMVPAHPSVGRAGRGRRADLRCAQAARWWLAVPSVRRSATGARRWCQLPRHANPAGRPTTWRPAGRDHHPEHLFLAVLDQADPEAVALLSHAGLDLSIIRTTALDILGAPSDLPSEPHRAEPSSGGWIEGAFMPARATRRGPAPLPITRPDPWVHTRAPV